MDVEYKKRCGATVNLGQELVVDEDLERFKGIYCIIESLYQIHTSTRESPSLI